jgi:hypothetical protein
MWAAAAADRAQIYDQAFEGILENGDGNLNE